jgi:hypothetical protein
VQISNKNFESILEIKLKEAQLKVFKVEQKRRQALIAKENIFLEKQSKIIQWVDKKEKLNTQQIQIVQKEKENEIKHKVFVKGIRS